MELEDVVAQDEGLRLKPYRDTQGVWTIGYGRNLDDVGISQEEADHLRANDCARARREAASFYWYPALDPVRRLVLLSMLFQLGLPRVLEFDRMILALKSGNFGTASEEMLNSLWARQTPNRAQKLSRWMATGVCE